MTTSVFIEAILNLAWAAICLTAFTWLIAVEKRCGQAGGRTIVYRAVALSLALVSLFPCVSASDDWVRLQFLAANAAPNTAANTEGLPAGSQHKLPASGDQPDSKAFVLLVRMLEALDSVQVTVALALSVVLSLFALALIETHRSLDRFLPARAGRAPPFSIPV